MSRIRTVKPEFASDKTLSMVSRDARLTFVLLITQADDYGMLRATDRELLGALYPHDESVTASSLREWLASLAREALIRFRETLDGAPVIEIMGWSKHQKIDHPSKPIISLNLKAFNHSSSIPREALAIVSRSDLVPRTKDLNTTCASASPSAMDPDGFKSFWQHYPRKKSRGDAVKAWRKIKPSEQLTERIVHAVEQAKTSNDWRKDGGQFIPYPASWLNSRGWEDENNVQQEQGIFG